MGRSDGSPVKGSGGGVACNIPVPFTGWETSSFIAPLDGYELDAMGRVIVGSPVPAKGGWDEEADVVGWALCCGGRALEVGFSVDGKRSPPEGLRVARFTDAFVIEELGVATVAVVLGCGSVSWFLRGRPLRRTTFLAGGATEVLGWSLDASSISSSRRRLFLRLPADAEALDVSAALELEHLVVAACRLMSA